MGRVIVEEIQLLLKEHEGCLLPLKDGPQSAWMQATEEGCCFYADVRELVGEAVTRCGPSTSVASSTPCHH